MTLEYLGNLFIEIGIEKSNITCRILQNIIKSSVLNLTNINLS